MAACSHGTAGSRKEYCGSDSNRHSTDYFRPIPGNTLDEYYFHEYLGKERSRVKELKNKVSTMETTYEMWRKESADGL